MKRKFVLFVSAMICAVCPGCLENEELQQTRTPVGKLTISVGGAGSNVSKASGTAGESDEDRIGSVQIFLFAEDGRIEAESYSRSSEVSIVSTMGRKTLGVVVNCDEIGDISELTELDSKITRLKDNAADSFVMYRTVPVEMDAEQKTVEVQVRRLVSKIVVNKISNRMELAPYRSSPVLIKGIYLINVAGEASMDGLALPGTWLNRQGKENEENSLYAEFPSSLSIAFNGDDTSGHCFYCYPNPTDGDSSDPVWSVRHTRLVIEAVLDGKTCYYPATLPVLESNKVYTVNEFVLTRPGTDRPDEECAVGDMEFSLSVEPWGNEYMDNVTI
ncbi:MAG: hypothetical protein ACI39U_02565 [Candidatus Cryptobacteroides sp.]